MEQWCKWPYSRGLMLAMSSKMMVNDKANHTSSKPLAIFRKKFQMSKMRA
jgi:hypothetical protein